LEVVDVHVDVCSGFVVLFDCEVAVCCLLSLIVTAMSEEATLQLKHDGKSNVLRIRRGVVTGVNNIVVDFSKQLPWNQDDADVNSLNKHNNTIAQSTDFVCSHPNCSYHHKSESRYILHARSHFAFEVAPDAVCDTEFKWTKGKYTCSKCPRSTADWLSFREHVRHHIVEKPYKCSICTIEIASVPELRIHFQMYHFGKPADFVFNGSVYDLNVLLSMLLPEVSAVTEPLNISFNVPADTRTRISCTSAFGEMHPVGLMKELLSDDNRKKRKELCEANKRAFLDDSTVVKQVSGTYEYSRGIYECITCCYKTPKEKMLARHAWEHIHGSGWKNACFHNTSSTLSGECAIISGLLEMLKRVELSRLASESLEKSSSLVSAENSKYYISSNDKNCNYENIAYCQKIQSHIHHYVALPPIFTARCT